MWGGEPAEESQRQPQTNPSNPDDPGYIVELRRLAELRGRGIITEEEFEAKKRRLLDL